jgi:purine-binding chemotaxis protein CheW
MTSARKQRIGAAKVDWDEINQRLEHTRNAIKELLDPGQDRQQQILRERAVSLARNAVRTEAVHTEAVRTESAAPAAHDIEVLEFTSAGERYAFEAACVAQVNPMCAITPIPGTPDFVVGIISVEGDILSVIDLRSLLDLPISRLTEPTSIIILKGQTIEFGILAEEILGIKRYSPESVERELPALTDTVNTYLKGVTSTRTAILDADQLLSDPRLVVEVN